MSFGTLTGKSQLIGFGNPQAYPITLDPVAYEGAVVYADNEKLYFSDGTQWIELSSGGTGTTVSAILPFAFIRVDDTNAITGTGISASNWDGINGTMDFTFDTAQPDTDYTVITDGELNDDGRLVSIQNKTVNGFEASFYTPSNVSTPSSANVFAILVFASDPVSQIGQGQQGIQGATGAQGLQGSYGPGFNIIGSIAGPGDQSSLNTAFPGATTGQAVVDQSDDTLWVYDGSVWVNIGTFRGVQGFQGPQGIQGVQGPLGNEGIQGERGFRGFQGVQGWQGTQGVQGDLGFQGIQGFRGPQGVQGITGIQGDLGFQGTQGRAGPQGVQGITGIQGDTGTQGATGDFGGITYDYTYSNNTVDSDPGTGIVKFSSTNLAAVGLYMYVDDEDDGGVGVMDGIATELAGVGGPIKGYVRAVNGNNIYDQVLFRIEGVTDKTGYWQFDVVRVSGVTALTNGTDIRLSFMKEGEQGIQGITGIQGTTGTQGPQGTQGLQGLQGPQGTTGIQGNTGIQGTQGTRGPQGVQGLQGITGSQGVQGNTGDFGGITYDYTYSDNVAAADPGIGFLRINNIAFASATQIYIDDQDDGSTNVMDGLMTDLAASSSGVKGYVKIIQASNVNNFVTFRIDNIVNGTGYWVLDVAKMNGINSLSDGEDIRVTFSRTGDQGTQGIQGIQGLLGIQGIQGLQGVQGEKGIQGDTGIQGFQGIQGEAIQGVQGVQGTTGIQGLQGLQGNAGSTGAQGIQGLQGTTGIQGLQGLQGEQGQYGGLTWIWNFSNNIIGGTDPGTNNFKFNNANPTLATLITLDDVPADQYTQEIDDFLDWIASQPGTVKGYLKVQEGNYNDGSGPAGHHWLVYEITDWTWDSGSKNYGYFDVTYVDGNVTSWQLQVNAVHGPATLITFIPRGPAGIQGIQGIQGVQGVQGRTGAGTQGPQGLQGSLGLQGAEGSFGGVTFDYTFSTNTINNDPGVGYLKFNNSTYSSVTSMYIDDRDDNFVDIQPFIRTVDDSTSPIKGHFKVTKKSQPEIFQIFTISALAELTGYFNITCAFVSGNGTFANDEDVTITFARTGDTGATGSTGPQGVQGLQGTTGIQGLQGRDGAGAQGIQGLQGTTGIQGSDGATGGVGPQGIQGLQGADGSQGAGGFQGPGGVGAQGIQGIQGLTGAQGIGGVGAGGFQGAAGAQGIQGVQGSDGSGGTQGPQGLQGPSAIGAPGPQGIQGIQGTSGIGGQGVIGVQGVQGLQGPLGLQGFIGAQGSGGVGPQGTQGPQGIDGTTGTGVQGLTGIQGPQGVQGPFGLGAPGVQGYRGFQGFQGTVGGDGGSGIQGAQGANGFQGVQGGFGTGLQGIQGTTGIQGPQGLDGGSGGSGPQGTAGAQGIQGFRGIQGFSGQGTSGGQGPAGPQGADGLAGAATQGPAGVAGPQGTRGFQGYTGTQGAFGSGSAGPQGFAGAPGVQGFRGVQGYIGFQGIQGVSGVTGSGLQGDAGIQGPQGPIGFQGSAGSASGVNPVDINTQNSVLQTTASMKPTFVTNGSGVRDLYIMSSVRYNGTRNITLNLNTDTIIYENADFVSVTATSMTLGGSTITTWPSGGGGSFDGTATNTVSSGKIVFQDGSNGGGGSAYFGTGEDVQFYNNGTAMYFDFDASHDLIMREGTTTRFTFDTGTGDFTATGNVTTNSDERLKENIQTLESSLDKVKALRGVSYNKIDNERHEIGLIAQEVEKVLPEVVGLTSEGYKSVSYGNIVGLLIEAIKEQQKQIDELKSK